MNIHLYVSMKISNYILHDSKTRQTYCHSLSISIYIINKTKTLVLQKSKLLELLSLSNVSNLTHYYPFL